VVQANVKAKNNLGILAETCAAEDDPTPVLDIIVPKRAAGIASEIDLDAVELRDTIFVEVMGKRYQLNDTKISIIGRAVKEMRPTDAANAYDDDGDDEPERGRSERSGSGTESDGSKSEEEDEDGASDDEQSGEDAARALAAKKAHARALQTAIKTTDATAAAPAVDLDEEDEDDEYDGEEEEDDENDETDE